jgi:PPP family 3-phenylpropionic acid transporter
MFAAYGVASPFLPAFLNQRGVTPDELGLVLAAGTAIRLVAAPVAGRIGDLTQALRIVLVACIAAAAAVTLGYLPAHGFGPFLLLTLLHAAFLAPMTVLSDALALASSRRQRFEYGRVRGTGSAAFIAGTLLSGQLVGALGLAAIVWSQASLLALAALAARRVPELAHEKPAAPSGGGVGALLRIPLYASLLLAAALILGSHAMHDAFAMIRWSAAGVSPAASSALWSLAVVAEVVVFFAIGPPLIARLTPAGAIALASLAGALRWAVMAQTTSLAALALIQPLHGITFALFHLACMRLIARIVPPGLEGTAQALYATGAGLATALLILLSGFLYSRWGAQGFWAMAALCVVAFPLALKLRS